VSPELGYVPNALPADAQSAAGEDMLDTAHSREFHIANMRVRFTTYDSEVNP
jgi:hypothetical protein